MASLEKILLGDFILHVTRQSEMHVDYWSTQAVEVYVCLDVWYSAVQHHAVMHSMHLDYRLKKEQQKKTKLLPQLLFLYLSTFTACVW